jgi:hypothetical protein
VARRARHAAGGPATTEEVADIGRESESKRRNEARRSDRRKLKDERRQERQSSAGTPVDEAAMMERFQALNERRAAGTVSEAEYEVQRSEIFVALGLEDPVEATEPPDEA